MTTKPAAEVPNLSPEELNSVDEIMVPIKGRSYLRQYLPNNTTNGGLKSFMTLTRIKAVLIKWQIYYAPLFQKKKIIKCLLATSLLLIEHLK